MFCFLKSFLLLFFLYYFTFINSLCFFQNQSLTEGENLQFSEKIENNNISFFLSNITYSFNSVSYLNNLISNELDTFNIKIGSFLSFEGSECKTVDIIKNIINTVIYNETGKLVESSIEFFNHANGTKSMQISYFFTT